MMRCVPAAVVALILLTVAGCSRDEEQRQEILVSARQSQRAVLSSQTVRELQAAPEPGRMIYTPPVSLSAASAEAANTAQVWAPFGIALPDSTKARTQRRR
jgi:hypothetical protein